MFITTQSPLKHISSSHSWNVSLIGAIKILSTYEIICNVSHVSKCKRNKTFVFVVCVSVLVKSMYLFNLM